MRDITARSLEEIHSKVLRDAVEYAKGQRGIEMFIEGLNENQDEIWENSAKATRREDIELFYKNGVSIDLISKSLGFSKEEILEIVNRSRKEK